MTGTDADTGTDPGTGAGTAPETGTDPGTGAVREGRGAGETAAYGAALVRAELAARELWLRVALIVGLCAGAGFLASGIYDYTHVGRPDGTGANLSLVTGVALVAATSVLLVPLALKSRDRRRLLELYGAPRGPRAQRALRRSRAAWLTLSGIALALAGLFLASGLTQAFSSDPYEEPDPTLYGTFLVWTAILSAAGCAGIAKARRHRATGSGAGATSADRAGAGSGSEPGSGASGLPPRSPSAVLYSGLGSEPAAPHRLSPRLSARIRGLSRGGAVTAAVSATLLGCALALVAALVPHRTGAGQGLFWTLAALTALYLLALLLELAHYGPRRRYLLLVVFASLALVGVAWNGFSTSILLDRGQWVATEVTEVRHQAKGGPVCELRPLTPGRMTAETEEGLSISTCGAPPRATDCGSSSTPRARRGPAVRSRTASRASTSPGARRAPCSSSARRARRSTATAAAPNWA